VVRGGPVSSPGTRAPGPSRLPWPALGVSVVVGFLILHGSATALGSFRGEAGLPVALLVVGACLISQRLLSGQALGATVRTLGLGVPSLRSLGIALGVSLLLLGTIPVVAALTQSRVALYPGWPLLIPGLFAQAGVAEETLFRGHLFGTLRRQYPFWRAALLSAVPFVAAHLLLFATMPWPVALASTGLALVTSFPLARLFELGGRTIWAPALAHFTMQGAVKVIELPAAGMSYPMAWLAACAVLPWVVFAFRVPRCETEPPSPTPKAPAPSP
jgi:membrane protease YdiL (CAAX protease family)